VEEHRAALTPFGVSLAPWWALLAVTLAPSSLSRADRYNVYKDHITLADYEIHDGMGLELYYN
jgi:hypothetical protein